ncbi:MAG: trypsin-like peptidase domain-containing protein [Spirochaetia bacterium]|nr:trypsin-like peptidase domain-containing protein [Spirochaetia bacterium]
MVSLRSAGLLAFSAVLALSPAWAQQGGLKAPEGISEEEFKEAVARARGVEIVYRAIYESVRPSVVHIAAQVTQKRESQSTMPDPFFFFGPNGRPIPPVQVRSEGTGFFVEQNLIVTNSHVVGTAKKVKVKLSDGRVLDGVVRGTDGYSDLALIDVKGADNVKSVRIADSDSVHVGDLTVAVGNPMGLEGTFTTGVVSAIRRPSPDGRAGKVIQTDASINVGNSGGPLLNLRGEVIGINFMTISPNGGSVGLGFAIPMNEVRPVIAAVKTSGSVERPFLGIQLVPVPPDIQKERGILQGAFVVSVLEGTGAEKAGIQPNDIVLKADSEAIVGPDDLVNYVIGKKHVGERVVLL